MIQLKSLLNVVDNSGATVVECIKILRNATIGTIGKEIVVVVKKARPISDKANMNLVAAKLRKGDVRRAVVVRVKKEYRRLDGRYVRFPDNACVLLNHSKQPLGTRVLGVVAAELRKDKNWSKIANMAPKVI